MTVYGPNHIFEFAVVGGGMFGAAAARHLAEAGQDVVLLAPPEPEHRDAHRGPFASHHDEARITRMLDTDPLWSALAAASIARYPAIEAAAGLTFHQPVGYLGIAADHAAPRASELAAAPGRLDSAPTTEGPPGGFVDNSMRIGTEAGAAVEALDASQVATRFPYLAPYPGETAFLEHAPAGYINPRALVRAQLALAAAAGATVLPRTAVQVTDAIDAVDVLTDTAERVLARRALIAAGAYTNQLLIRPLAFEVQARTLLFARLDARTRERLAGMPGVIHVPSEAPVTYILPPVTYPDGETYVKIGVDAWHNPLATSEAVGAWFRDPAGDPEERARAERELLNLIPALEGAPQHTSTCVYTITATGYPYVGMVSERVAVCVGGNGKGAKSSDEIGRLGAAVLRGESVDDRLAPRFA